MTFSLHFGFSQINLNGHYIAECKCLWWYKFKIHKNVKRLIFSTFSCLMLCYAIFIHIFVILLCSNSETYPWGNCFVTKHADCTCVGIGVESWWFAAAHPMFCIVFFFWNIKNQNVQVIFVLTVYWHSDKGLSYKTMLLSSSLMNSSLECTIL